MSLDLKDYVIIGTSGFGTTVILNGLFHITGLCPTTIKRTLGIGLVNGLSITVVFAAIDNVSPIRKVVHKELFPDEKDDGRPESF